MTVAIGLYTKSGVSLLADRRTSFGSAILESCKIRKSGKMHYVVSGWTAARELFDTMFAKSPDMRRLRAAAGPELSSWNADGDPPGSPLTIDVAALVTDGKTLWRIGGDLIALEIFTPFAAIGSGGGTALGALHAGATPEEAIEIASRVCSACGNGCDRINVPKRAR